MSQQSWEEYIETQRGRYARASRKKKGDILDEGCALFGVNRKSLIRAFARKNGGGKREKRGRPALYGDEVLAVLKAIWLAADQPCSKRLVALLPAWLPHYERRAETLDAPLRQRILAISHATADRLLASARVRLRKRKNAAGAENQIQGQIPIRRHFQEVRAPGSFEVDTVAHGGPTARGAYVWSLTMTDIFSGWTENAAVWNKSGNQVARRLADIEERLPFPLLEFDSDNGSEFINEPVFKYLRQRADPIHTTRSRPYRKNDNAHVEQKQYTHVRRLLGYDRLDHQPILDLINDLYANEWRAMVNFFQPQMRLVSSQRDGSRRRRRHDAPRTPYERLLENNQVPRYVKNRLRREFRLLDPFALREAIELKLRRIFELQKAKDRRERKRLEKAKATSAA